MERTIRITGIGKAKAKPDTVQIPMTLEVRARVYEDALSGVSEKLSLLRHALESAGFDGDTLKTSDFSAEAVYSSLNDRSGSYTRVFDCYRCSFSLNFEFEFDLTKLSAALTAVAESHVCPELNIRFRVKDSDSLKLKMLETAALDANVKALALCKASGVQLGKLLNIDYSWSEINVYSDTNCRLESCEEAYCYDLSDITPEDVETKESVSFIWEIL